MNKPDEEQRERYLRYIRIGMAPSAAADAAGIDQPTLQCATDDEPEFRAAVKQAAAVSQARALATIQAAATGDWRAAAWYLERTNPHDFAKGQTPPDNTKPQSATTQTLDPETEARLVQSLAEFKAARGI